MTLSVFTNDSTFVFINKDGKQELYKDDVFLGVIQEIVSPLMPGEILIIVTEEGRFESLTPIVEVRFGMH